MSAEGAVVSVLPLRIRPGNEEAVIRFYEQRDVFEHARRSGGFRSGRLLEPRAEGEPFLVIAEWDDAGSYHAWLDNPVRAELGVDLVALLEDEPEAGSVYQQVG
jgi:heme-degrading monooxygenase HmoA